MGLRILSSMAILRSSRQMTEQVTLFNCVILRPDLRTALSGSGALRE